MNKKNKNIIKIIILIAAIVFISYPLFLGNFINQTIGLNKDPQLKDVSTIDFDIEDSVIDDYNDLVAEGLFSTDVDIFNEEEVAQFNINDFEGSEFINKVRSKDGFEKVIGYIDIPKLKERILLFYGTDDKSLERGAGILENTSFPSHKPGGIHTVLAGHRGMTNLNVFRHIDKLSNGDVIELNIGDERFVYSKTGMIIREPGKLEDLQIHDDKNLLTIITCHPYLINNKRMLVYFEKV